jgi:Ras-related GTP-binding protein A/B
VHSLIPNAATLSRHLTTFAQACAATEVVLFERTTFLVIATSDIAPPTAAGPLTPAAELPSPSRATPSSLASTAASGSDAPEGPAELHGLEPTRYERTSELVKAFKHSCARMRSEFHALEFEFPEFTAVLDEMTKNMYVLVIVHDPHIGRLDSLLVYNSSSLAPAETAAIRINIELARRKFEELQSDSTLG